MSRSPNCHLDQVFFLNVWRVIWWDWIVTIQHGQLHTVATTIWPPLAFERWLRFVWLGSFWNSQTSINVQELNIWLTQKTNARTQNGDTKKKHLSPDLATSLNPVASLNMSLCQRCFSQRLHCEIEPSHWPRFTFIRPFKWTDPNSRGGDENPMNRSYVQASHSQWSWVTHPCLRTVLHRPLLNLFTRLIKMRYCAEPDWSPIVPKLRSSGHLLL